MTQREIAVFALRSSRTFGERVAQRLGLPLAEHEERDFDWGQHKSRSLESVRGRDVYVLHSLHGEPGESVNDKLCRLLFFLGGLRDAGARRLTAVVPYLCYSRKDRKTKARDPVTTRYVAALFEAVGVDCVVTLEVHNLAAFQNAFRCRTEHLEAQGLVAEYVASRVGEEEVVVVSPDVGGTKRAARYRAALERRLGRAIPGAFVEKYRSEGRVWGDALVGEVQGRSVLLVDDLASGGTTLSRAAAACHAAGCRRVLAAVAHGTFTPEAPKTLAESPLERIAVLDHVLPFPAELPIEPLEGKLEVLDASGLVAEAIRRMHEGGSLVELAEAPEIYTTGGSASSR